MQSILINQHKNLRGTRRGGLHPPAGPAKLLITLALTTSLMSSSSYVAASAANQVISNTSTLQAQVLTKINHGLSTGSISPQQATSLKEELNIISEHETIYESYGLPTPQTIIKKDFDDLNALSAKVDGVLAVKHESTDRSANVMHRDIHKLISTALAGNKITNAQAEDYYSCLAQIEGDMENLNGDPASSRSETLALDKNLLQLRADIEKHTSHLLTLDK